MATDTITTVARPYAKAAFEIALQQDRLVQWSDMLMILAQVSLNKDIQTIVNQPGSTEEQLADMFIQIAGEQADSSGQNFIKILASNKRLMVLPEIKATYELFKAEQEKSLNVCVISFAAMTDKQKQDLSLSLKQRLKREISISETIDPSILGGVIIRAGDLVIDGSVKGKLEKLKTEIAA